MGSGKSNNQERIYEYHFITVFEKEKILFQHLKEKSFFAIAIELNRPKVTISHELKRNSFVSEYLPYKTQEYY